MRWWGRSSVAAHGLRGGSSNFNRRASPPPVALTRVHAHGQYSQVISHSVIPELRISMS